MKFLLRLFSLLFFSFSGIVYADLIGKPIPDFTLPILNDSYTSFSSSSLCGQVVLVNLWASWCYACQYEHAVLMNIKATTKIPIYGINYEDHPERANAWLNKAGNPFVLNGMDADGSAADSLESYGLPETFVLDANGIIRYIYQGALTEQSWNNTVLPIVEHYIALANKTKPTCKK